MIPYGRQDINEADIEAVIKVLQSDFLTQGPVVPRFEEMLANYCNAKYGVAVNSATSALHIACLALGLGPDDWLWTSPNSFVASANCALYCGAQVDFVDIDPRTYNLSVSALEKKLIQAELEGKLPKIVIPVHFSGQSCDMKAIHALAQRYNFKIIEDASHAIGGKYKGEPIGNCRYSDATVFSFHPVKIITTAEGGIVLTNDAELSEKMASLRSHGITRDPQKMDKASDGSWYYQQIELGFNYRMTELQAALGISQMKRLDQFVTRRHQIAKYYNEALIEFPLLTPWQHLDSYSAFHLYVIRLAINDLKVSHRQVFENLRAQGIGVNLHYIPIHTQPYYKKLGFREGQFPEAENYYSEAITLPMYPGLTEEQQTRVIEVLANVLQGA
ncbi:UDP-4-amino-4,6-dideoxy-N-acetyl-beta-L-altrosamine transaminase [Legionella brunensis]|uniref:AHBA synthase n=1 Tax=Legionella brunensis TaxID=29422 RepID=A0A0W0SEB8_9GAMM|nr:UDP-4-amino-4,6-dideoxy-N-acetyl-beta-L-altrosamine transaminase [Legionella brunensis]KTC81437.1 AHBA synthase [Legionella brunensis]